VSDAFMLSILDLERVGADEFVAPNPGEFSWGRVFGGQVVAQALRAAQLTVDSDHSAHSVHAYFVRGGAPGTPIGLDVHHVRDGRSFTTRNVTATQDGQEIFIMSCSFHKSEEGAEYQLPPSDVPPPEAGSAHPHGGFSQSLEVRELGPSEPDDRGIYASTRRLWVRVSERMPDDPALHQCAIAFISDLGTSMGARVPRMISFEHWGGASLDHAVWFHRPARADEWLLFDLHAVSNFGARGLARGTMHTADGDLAVSVVQEALLRPTGRTPGMGLPDGIDEEELRRVAELVFGSADGESREELQRRFREEVERRSRA
jgi:acyl-CoA thioesterase-2